jgi:predicted transcriptional regulator
LEETQSKKFQDKELQAILDQNLARTPKELASLLDVSQNAVSKYLKTMGKVQKKENKFRMNYQSWPSKIVITLAFHCFQSIRRSSFCIKV